MANAPLLSHRPDQQVFLVLWWWFVLLTLIGLTVLVYRGVQCRYR